jgi:carboxypeptidase A4
MKFLVASLATLGLVSAAAVQSKVDYTGWKVFRVNVGEDSAKLGAVVDSLQLQTWKGKVATSKVVDLVVPPAQVEKFKASTGSMNIEVMHEDLGASIAAEEVFETYACTYYLQVCSYEGC